MSGGGGGGGGFEWIILPIIEWIVLAENKSNIYRR